MRHLYFAYGMNTNAHEMARRCPGSRVLGKAYLDGYRFVFRGHADVELADRDDYVVGVLWEIDDRDLESLDVLEGFPDYYLRQRVRVEYDERELVAWVYTMEDQSFTSDPHQSYFDMCHEGYEFFGVETQQLFDALHNEPKEILNA